MSLSRRNLLTDIREEGRVSTAEAVLDLGHSDIDVRVRCECGTLFEESGYEVDLLTCPGCDTTFAIIPTLALAPLDDEDLEMLHQCP